MSAAVLAGGASTRMGVDKRRLVIDGTTMLETATRAALAVSDDVMVVVSPLRRVDDDLRAGVRWREVLDRTPGAGPLAGVAGALAAARHPYVVILPVDAPRLGPDLLRLLIEQTMVSGLPGGMCMGPTGPEPLPCVVARDVLQVLDGLLARGERRMASLSQVLAMAIIEEDAWRVVDPRAEWLLNLNSPRDLAALTPGNSPSVADVGAS